MSKVRIHDYYLTEDDEGRGYLVKSVNYKGEVELVSWASYEDYDWFGNRDFVRVSREEWERVGQKKES